MPATDQTRLAEAVAEFYADPLGFVLFAFPWGEPGTPLEHEDGPDEWQRAFLRDLGESVRANGFNGRDPVAPIREAIASGHGIGKSACVAWLILWLMSTRPNCKGTVTASTAPQLETKTWPELAKWHKLCAARDWFEITTGRGSMKIVAKSNPEGWRCTAQTSREENSESFAGQHAADSTSFYIFDEASAIPSTIWDVAEGGLTDGEPMIFAFGNPTRNSGRFHETFHRLRHRWRTRHIDSRTAKRTNKALIAQWVSDHGEDSDFVKVRVRGLFPSQSSAQFIATDLIAGARTRVATEDLAQRLIIFVDVARFGDDATVIGRRRGRDARSWPWLRRQGQDTMWTVGEVVRLVNEHTALGDPPIVMVDGGGVGGGVVDRLRQLGVDVIEVQFGAKADDPRTYGNKRAECWGRMREWLAGGAIPDEQRLADDLGAPEYFFDAGNAIKLEPKDAMKARGLASPDDADALAVSFAVPVPPRTFIGQSGGQSARTDYDPFSR